jgi:hypothetical protein
MATASRNQREGTWDDRLVCRVRWMTYDFRSRTGRLDFPAGDCCDMTGAVSIFTAIDPEVRAIETYAGGEPDVFYRRNGRGWSAYVR